MRRQIGITYKDGNFTPLYETGSMILARVAAFALLAFVLAGIVGMLALL